MPYYGIKGKIKERIDSGNNVFVGKKCINPTIALPHISSVNDFGDAFKSTRSFIGETTLQITGHVPNFEYAGSDGKTVKVSTGHKAY